VVAAQGAPQVALVDADRVRRLAAAVEDAGDLAGAAEAARVGGAATLALGHGQLDSLTGHGAGV
jgi:hypothetical protein